jgi:LacI family repressor for deo operon, udp, cdd, tsx, nupC, and nupG
MSVSFKKTPTIQDVARQARVSAATVSRVLSNPDRVAEATRLRVKEAVRATGYTMNQAARSLRLKSARTVLMAVPNIGNPFYSTILDAVIRAAAARNFSVLVASRLGDDPNRWLSDYLHSNRADGLLLFHGGLDTGTLHNLGTPDAPLPLVASYDELPDEQINSVITDNRQAARRAVQHLVALGHRRIAHVIGPSRNGSSNERMLGYYDGMQEAGLAIVPEYLVQGNYTMRDGVVAAEHYARLRQRPTAVFAGNDEMAIGLISRLTSLGIRVPQDMSVMGFDDIPFADFLSPSLTTMRQPRDQIGRIATTALIDIIEGVRTDAEPLHVVLNAELVIRASTAPYRGS